MFTFEPMGTLSCELPDANSPLVYLDLALLTCGLTSFSIGSGVGNGAGGAGGTGGGGGNGAGGGGAGLLPPNIHIRFRPLLWILCSQSHSLVLLCT